MSKRAVRLAVVLYLQGVLLGATLIGLVWSRAMGDRVGTILLGMLCAVALAASVSIFFSLRFSLRRKLHKEVPKHL
jgi:uncharacterized membrane-anchored protein YitT (DUF2179 family)